MIITFTTATSGLPTCPLREEKSFLKSLCDTECYVKIASIANGQFQSELPIFEINENENGVGKYRYD